MKKEFIEEKYLIKPSALIQKKINNVKEEGYSNKEIYEFFVNNYKKILIDKEIPKDAESINDLLKGGSSFEVESQHKTDNLIYLLLPAYAFCIWAVPIIIFSLLGLVFKNK
jgi:hypothetical protein